MKLNFLFLVFIAFSSCSDDPPDCIADEINNFQTVQADCENATVTRYEFQGQTLYGFTDGACIIDGGTRLLDEMCNDFCFIGGIAALTDCEGINFVDNAEEKEVIWVNRP